MSEKVRIAVCGGGNWGRNHIKTFAGLEWAKLVGICDANESLLENHREKYSDIVATKDFDALLQQAKPDAVVIATPAETHHNLTVQAIEAGVDVLCEKPLALFAEEAKMCVQFAEDENRILMVGHLMLYHPAFVALKKLVDDGELGDILNIHSERTNFGSVRSEENVWWSLAPHDISMVNALMGCEPNSVSANGSAWLQPGIEDSVTAELTYPDKNGLKPTASIHVSWLFPEKRRKLTVIGTKKMAVLDDTEPVNKLKLFDLRADVGENIQLHKGGVEVIQVDDLSPLDCECNAFLDAVLTRIPPIADGWNGISVTKILAEALS